MTIGVYVQTVGHCAFFESVDYIQKRVIKEKSEDWSLTLDVKDHKTSIDFIITGFDTDIHARLFIKYVNREVENIVSRRL